MKITTANVNGIRAAYRRGMADWLESEAPDILCLQEVRAPEGMLADHLGAGWFVHEAVAAAKGRAGVAIASRAEPTDRRTALPGFETDGRWVEADFATGSGPLTVISAYVHTGEAETSKQDDKYRFLEQMRVRMAELMASGQQVLIVGDLNVAHQEIDLKNFKGNRKNSGFLPEERQWFTDRFAEGWVDVARQQAGEVPGPYSWWTWRGQAFDNDTGWRIDYHIASPQLADTVKECFVGRAPSYDQRWSDHAPVTAVYGI